jgi:hypothetical protein
LILTLGPPLRTEGKIKDVRSGGLCHGWGVKEFTKRMPRVEAKIFALSKRGKEPSSHGGKWPSEVYSHFKEYKNE